jgi:hypothetical protein
MEARAHAVNYDADKGGVEAVLRRKSGDLEHGVEMK